jgi:hypothetical protein
MDANCDRWTTIVVAKTGDRERTAENFATVKAHYAPFVVSKMMQKRDKSFGSNYCKSNCWIERRIPLTKSS